MRITKPPPYAPCCIAGKGKRRDAGEHLLVAESFGEALHDDAGGRGWATAPGTRAPLQSRRRRELAPELEELLHVIPWGAGEAGEAGGDWR